MNKFFILVLYSLLIMLLCAGGSNKCDSTSIPAAAFTDKGNASYQNEYIPVVPVIPIPVSSSLPIESFEALIPVIVENMPADKKTVEETASSENISEHQPKISELADWYASNETGMKVPILMYHNLLEGNAPGDSLNVSAEVFDDQMYYLKAHGYNTITFSDLYNHYMNGSPLAENPIIITFDDGYVSNYTIGYPILKKYGFKACIFVITDAIGRSNYLTEGQLREMSSSGVIDVQNHSASHSYYLYADSKEDMAEELSKSRSRIENITGKEVNVFCYTCGKYSQRLVDELIEQNYIFSVTTKYGIASKNTHPFLLPRLRVLGSDSGKTLNAKITKLTGRVTKYTGMPEETSPNEPIIVFDESMENNQDTYSGKQIQPEEGQPVDSESILELNNDSETESDQSDSEGSVIPDTEPESESERKPIIDTEDEI
ncbi:MAG: polysaccharide deacetylase family protein [Clostridiaceae bacterium]|nr:polysaccharide deacetylase family protein [Clostridiaceae bacterium]